MPGWLNDGSVATRRVDGRHKNVITAPRDAAWMRQIAARQVLHTHLANGEAFDWFVSSKTDGVTGSGKPVAVLTCDPADVILSDVGPIREVVPGGGTYYEFQFDKLTPAELLEDYAIATLHDLGHTYITLGQVDPTVRLTGALSMTTPRALIRALQDATGALFKFQREGNTGYTINLVYDWLEQPSGAGAAQPRVSQGLNFIDLVRVRSREDLATVMIVRGAEVNKIRGPLGLALWVAGAATPETVPVGFRVPLTDELEGPGPIGFDNQLVGNGGTFAPGHPKYIPPRYIEFEDGTREQILASRFSDQTVVLASAPPEGELVRIAADSAGGLLTELESPLGVLAFGKVVSYYDIDDIVAATNLVRNGMGETWATKPTGYKAAARDTHFDVGFLSGGLANPDAFELRLDGILPANRTIPAGSLVMVTQASGSALGQQVRHPIYVTAAQATAVAGSVDLVTVNALPNWRLGIPVGGIGINLDDGHVLEDGDEVWIHENTLPSFWTDGHAAETARSLFAYRPSSARVVACMADGTQTFTPNDGRINQWVNLKNLPAGEVVYPGTYLVLSQDPALTSARSYVHEVATADGTGDVSVLIDKVGIVNGPGLGGFGSLIDNTPVYLVREALLGPSATGVVLFARKVNNAEQTWAPLVYAGSMVETRQARVPYFPDQPRVKVSAAIQLQRNLNTVGGPLVSVSPDAVRPPTLELWSNGALVKTVTPTQTFVPREGETADVYTEDIVLTAIYELQDTQGELLQVKVRGFEVASVGTPMLWGSPLATVSGISITLGESLYVPRGSPTRLHQDANLRLQERDGWAQEIQMTSVELVERWGISEEKLVLGAVIRGMVPEIGVDVELQIVEITWPHGDCSRPIYVLSAALPGVTQRLARMLRQKSSVKLEAVTGGVAPDTTGRVVTTPGTGSGGVGGGGTSGSPSLGTKWIIRRSTSPSALELAEQGLYIQDPSEDLDILQRNGTNNNELVEGTRGGLRQALNDGGRMGLLLSIWRAQRGGEGGSGAGNFVVNEHGSDADYPRNDDFEFNEWRGTVIPNNMQDGDTLILLFS